MRALPRLLIASALFSMSAAAQPVVRSAADDAVVQQMPPRPFASSDQSRRQVTTNKPWIPRGGVCVLNSRCVCSEPRDIDGGCPGSEWCASTTDGVNCMYLCEEPWLCLTMTNEECANKEPCNP
jgi:hypothetical protein